MDMKVSLMATEVRITRGVLAGLALAAAGSVVAPRCPGESLQISFLIMEIHEKAEECADARRRHESWCASLQKPPVGTPLSNDNILDTNDGFRWFISGCSNVLPSLLFDLFPPRMSITDEDDTAYDECYDFATDHFSDEWVPSPGPHAEFGKRKVVFYSVDGVDAHASRETHDCGWHESTLGTAPGRFMHRWNDLIGCREFRGEPERASPYMLARVLERNVSGANAHLSACATVAWMQDSLESATTCDGGAGCVSLTIRFPQEMDGAGMARLLVWVRAHETTLAECRTNPAVAVDCTFHLTTGFVWLDSDVEQHHEGASITVDWSGAPYCMQRNGIVDMPPFLSGTSCGFDLTEDTTIDVYASK
jgi:hypothetical protein